MTPLRWQALPSHGHSGSSDTEPVHPAMTALSPDPDSLMAVGRRVAMALRDDNRRHDAGKCGLSVGEPAIHIRRFRPVWGTSTAVATTPRCAKAALRRRLPPGLRWRDGSKA